jgi:transcriptional regulator with XRE-family HTH domain
MTPDELRAIRSSLGWTQAETAEHFGMSHRGYTYIEQGTTSAGNVALVVPPPIALAMLSIAFLFDSETANTPETVERFRQAVQREVRQLTTRPPARRRGRARRTIPSTERTSHEKQRRAVPVAS